MILRTKAEISEIRDRMNNNEKSADIYKDMNSKIDIKKRSFTNKGDMKKVMKRYPDLVFWLKSLHHSRDYIGIQLKLSLNTTWGIFGA